MKILNIRKYSFITIARVNYKIRIYNNFLIIEILAFYIKIFKIIQTECIIIFMQFLIRKYQKRLSYSLTISANIYITNSKL